MYSDGTAYNEQQNPATIVFILSLFWALFYTCGFFYFLSDISGTALFFLVISPQFVQVITIRMMHLLFSQWIMFFAQVVFTFLAIDTFHNVFFVSRMVLDKEQYFTYVPVFHYASIVAVFVLLGVMRSVRRMVGR